MDSFDFSTDFSLPSGLDELTIFGNAQQQQQQQSQQQQHGGAGAGGSGSGGASDGARSVNHASPAPSKNMAVLSPGNQRSDSPHTFSTGADGGPATVMGMQGLLMDGHAGPDGQQMQQQGGLQLTIEDLRRMLVEKEHAERLQNMHTALLRQQLEALQRQQQQNQHQQQPQQPHYSAPAQQPSQPAFYPYQQQHQHQQQYQGQPASSGAHSQSQAHYQPQMNAAQASGAQSTSAAGVMAQYGLITPVSSGAFESSVCAPQQHPFVSPLHMPGGSQPGGTGSDGAHRVMDHNVSNFGSAIRVRLG